MDCVKKEKLPDYNSRNKYRVCVVCRKRNTTENRIDWEGGSACKGKCYLEAIDNAGKSKKFSKSVKPDYWEKNDGIVGKYGTKKYSGFHRMVQVINRMRIGTETDVRTVYDKARYKGMKCSYKSMKSIMCVLRKCGYMKRGKSCHFYVMVGKIPKNLTSAQLWVNAGYGKRGGKNG